MFKYLFYILVLSKIYIIRISIVAFDRNFFTRNKKSILIVILRKVAGNKGEQKIDRSLL